MTDPDTACLLLRRVIDEVDEADALFGESMPGWHSPARSAFDQRIEHLRRQLADLSERLSGALAAVTRAAAAGTPHE